MPSWQSHVLHLCQYGFRGLNGRFAGLDVAKERRSMDFVARTFRPSASVQCSAVTANGVPAEWIAPIGLSTDRVAIYVHGGGFYSGSLAGARSVAGNIALASKARVLTIDY